MRVFVTGATGFIGSAIVSELAGAGHHVVGLARSEAAAGALTAAGAEVHHGSLEDLDSLRRGAAGADGVIHTAFIHDLVDIEAATRTDRRAIEAMGAALEGSGRALVIASGMIGRAPGRVLTEEDMPDPEAPAPRSLNELAALALARRGVRSSAVRLPPTVHGDGDHGFVPGLVATARSKGVSGYVGDGAARWAAVHRLDAARLFGLALEAAPAGSALHGVAEEGVPTRDIAEVVGRHLGIPTVSVPPARAAEHFGLLGRVLQADTLASSALTRERLGWAPTGVGLLADLERGRYFG